MDLANRLEIKVAIFLSILFCFYFFVHSVLFLIIYIYLFFLERIITKVEYIEDSDSLMHCV